MKEGIRRQILADLGIDVWSLRAPPVPAAPAPSGATPEPAAPAQPAAAAPVPAAPAPAALTPVVKRAVSAPAAAAPLTVLSIALPGVLMLVTGAPTQRELRLAADLLAAAAGDWRARPAMRRFRWPPELPAGAAAEAAASASAGVERALRAFVDKDVADHRVGTMLCTADLAARLGAGWPGCRIRVIMPLAELGQDPAGKRALWEFLAGASP
jgi:hypothetical protein